MEKTVSFIRAKLKKDYVFDGIKASGFDIVIPYKDRNIVLRLLREVWTRLKLPKVSIWYNKAVKALDTDVIIVKDPLMTADYMAWLRAQHPDKKIIFDYDNRVRRSLDPEKVRPYADEIWSYDQDDCRDYALRHKGSSYLDVYRVDPAAEPDIDVLYVGRDKGRLDQLLALEKQFADMGLKTHFHICADRSFLTWKNRIYRKFLPYDEYLELLRRSRSILNIVTDGQTSITQREMEAVFDNVKCITNNGGIRSFALYDESRFFCLNDSSAEEIEDFMAVPFRPVPVEDLKQYCFSDRIHSMIDG